MAADADFPPIRTIRDIEALEAVPLAERIETWDTCALVRQGAAIDPGKTAMVYLADADLDAEPFTLTYRELMARFDRTANLLRGLGVGPGDVVAFLMPTVPQAFYVQIGGMAAGIVCCVNWMQEPSRIAEILRAARARVLVALGPEPDFGIWNKVEAIRGELPDLRHVLTVAGPGGEIDPATDLDTLIARQPGDGLAFERHVGPEDTAAYVHSGGTTGAPKLARILHRGLAYKCWANTVIMAHRADERILADYPMFHIAGFFGRGVLPFVNGSTIVIPSAWGARSKRFLANYWKIIERYRISLLSGVPTTLSVLIDNPPDGEDVSSMRAYAPTGSAALPVETARRIERELGVRMLTTFGATEFTQNATMPPRDGDPRYGSTGIRIPYTEVKTVVVDAGGGIVRDCAVDEIGVVVVRGPSTIPGYVDPALDEGLYFPDGWLNSGDLGRIDADGYLWITGRAKDVIIRGGHNIDPSLIEDALSRHAAVRLVAAVGKPDAYAGELPVAYVQLRDGAAATPGELQAFGRARIAERAANPAEIFILDRMPLTDIGKPDKVALRNDAARRVFDAALVPLAADGVAVAVEVAPHAVHGTLATVTLSPRGAVEREAAERSVHDILDPFTIGHEVVWA